MPTRPAPDPGLPLADDDLWRFAEGTHDGLAHLLGAHLDEPHGNRDPGEGDDGDDRGGRVACTFRVWAPAAREVTVTGDFDGWRGDTWTLAPSDAGIWSARVPDVVPGDRYKYRVTGPDGVAVDKADPFAVWARGTPCDGVEGVAPRPRVG